MTPIRKDDRVHLLSTPDDPDPTRVAVPRDVYAGILAIRDSGLTNMLDRAMVTKLARKMGFKDAAAWLADPANRRAYAEGVFRGFKPVE